MIQKDGVQFFGPPHTYEIPFYLPLTELEKKYHRKKMNRSPNSSLSSLVGRYLGVGVGLCLAGLTVKCGDADDGK